MIHALARALAAVESHETRLLGDLDPSILSAIKQLARHLAGPVSQEDT